MFKSFLSKHCLSAVRGQQNIKRADPTAPVIPNYHIVTSTAGFVYLAYQL